MKKIIIHLLSFYITITALFIAFIKKPTQRYWSALHWVQSQLPLALFMYKRTTCFASKESDLKIILLQRILSAITRYAYIDLPLRCTNEALLLEYHQKFGGFILCTVHLGLTMAVFSVLEKMQLPVISISNGGPTQAAYGWNWGCKTPLRLIKNNAHSLLRARKNLAAGDILLAYSDYDLTRSTQKNALTLSPNIFKFASKKSIPMLFLDAKLAIDGVIEINVIKPTFPISSSTKELSITMEEFRSFVENRLNKPTGFKNAFTVDADARNAIK